jgi:hypothetical protein
MSPALDVIDAFVDGERVDPAALKRALAEPAGRDYFVDAWLLRSGLQDELGVDEAAPEPVASIAADRRASRSARSWGLVLAASIACLAIGFGAGRWLAASGGSPAEMGPTAPVEIQTTASPPQAPVVQPPSPTRVIQLEMTAVADTAAASSGGG